MVECNIGASFSLFLLSGDLGAFLATVYHNLIFSFLFSHFNVYYLDLLKFCDKNKFLELKKWGEDEKPISVDSLNKLGQWRVLTFFWHINMHKSDFLKTAERRAETLHDIAHGQGTQLLGSILVILMLIVFDLYYPELDFGMWYFLPVGIVFLHFFAFRKVILSIQNILSNFYVKEFEKQETPYVIYVNRKDLIKNL